MSSSDDVELQQKKDLLHSIQGKIHEYEKLKNDALLEKTQLSDQIKALEKKVDRAKEISIKQLHQNTDTQLQQTAYGHTSLIFFRQVNQCQLASNEELFLDLFKSGFDVSEDVVNAVMQFTYDHVKKIKAKKLVFTFTKIIINHVNAWDESKHRYNLPISITLDARWNHHLHGSGWNDGRLLQPVVEQRVWPGRSYTLKECDRNTITKKYQELLSHDNLVVQHTKLDNDMNILTIRVIFEN